MSTIPLETLKKKELIKNKFTQSEPMCLKEIEPVKTDIKIQCKSEHLINKISKPK